MFAHKSGSGGTESKRQAAVEEIAEDIQKPKDEAYGLYDGRANSQRTTQLWD